MSWHAIFVQTGKEDAVCLRITEMLKQKGYNGNYDILVPKRRMQERHQGKFVEVLMNMFPGYVLIRSNKIMEIYQITKKCLYIYKYLCDSEGIQEIGYNEISNIMYMMDSNGIIGISDVFVENDMIKVIDGPLCNYTGIIKKIDKRKRRAKVAFKFSGNEHLVDLSINVINKLNDEEIKNQLYFQKTDMSVKEQL